MRWMSLLLAAGVALLAVDSSAAEPRRAAKPVAVSVEAELGFLSALSHQIQFSQTGTKIDYRKDGGQDVLFPFTRLSTQLDLFERHSVTLLYQPLRLRTRTVAPRDLVVDDQTFEEGTPMEFTYGFPFWRLGWAYDLLPSPNHDLRLGLGLQIRNATIEFASLDGEQLVSNRDVGPVPLLRVFGRTTLESGTFFEGEVDGFYAPIKYINGSGSDVVGAIVDLNLRAGQRIAAGAELFLNLRYLGGGAEGTSSDDNGPGDGFQRNWLHFMTLSLGARLPLL